MLNNMGPLKSCADYDPAFSREIYFGHTKNRPDYCEL